MSRDEALPSGSSSGGDTWHALPVEEIATAFGVSPLQGLSAAEAAELLRRLGPNILPEPAPPTRLTILFSQFRSLFVYILLAAAAVSAALGDVIEAVAILAILALNAILGFLQEYRSQQALQALRSMVAREATVLRDSRSLRVPIAELVPGDILEIEAGDVIAADGRLVDANDMHVSEALLTGESLPVQKSTASCPVEAPVSDRSSMVYQGTSVATGRGRAILVATGSNTEMGHIARLISSGERQETPLQDRLESVGRFLVFGALVLSLGVFGLGVARGVAAGEMFLTAASLAVAAIPEGLPAATTVVLALGVQRMARHNAVVRRLSSVETLGSVSVIFTDKTGTLTENRMAVERFWSAEPGSAALNTMALCNNAHLADGEVAGIGDPTEVALLQFARASGVDPAVTSGYSRLAEIPFQAARARMTVVVRSPAGDLSVHTKGAPESVLPLCGPEAPAGTRPWVTDAASTGLRVLALASRRLDLFEGATGAEEGLTLVGLVALGDPLRPEAAAALVEAAASGVRVVMLTGDHPITAAAVGARLGLEGQIVTGPEVESLSESELALRQGSAQIFARVTSQHKLRIVTAARGLGEIVAMTGDGVNDAPALSAADIGIAMGLGGTDVAREASDMVLLDNRFASIVEAIRQGRTIYANIQRFVHFLLACNLAELAVIFSCLLIWSTSPLTPLQILFVNLLTDGLPALALGIEPEDPAAMRRPPRRGTAGILSVRSFVPILGVGGAVTASTLLAFAIGLSWEGADLAKDMTLATLVGAHLGAAFVFRNELHSIVHLRVNYWLIGAVLSSLTLLALVYQIDALASIFEVHSLKWDHLLAVGALSVAPLLAAEAIKLSGVLPRLGLLPDR